MGVATGVGNDGGTERSTATICDGASQMTFTHYRCPTQTMRAGLAILFALLSSLPAHAQSGTVPSLGVEVQMLRFFVGSGQGRATAGEARVQRAQYSCGYCVR